MALTKTVGTLSPSMVRKTYFLRHLYIKTIFLPRQARDKPRENSKKYVSLGRDPWYCVDGKGGHGLCTPDTPAPYNTTLWHTSADGSSVTATVMGSRER
jgi:hypothetical protein